MRRTPCLILVVFLAGLLACVQPHPDPNKVGVFCQASDGLHQLTAYAEDNGLDVVKITGSDAVDAVPTITSPQQFFVNLPDAPIADAKVYWPIAYGQRGSDFSQRPYRIVNTKAASPLAVSIELVKGNMYRITCDALKGKTDGLAALVVGGRYYLVDLNSSTGVRASSPSAAAATVATVVRSTPEPQQPETGMVGMGTFTAQAPDQSTVYVVQLWKDGGNDEVVGWIMHGSGCNDPFGRLEDVRYTAATLSFTAKLHDEQVGFAGEIAHDALKGTMRSTWVSSDAVGKHVPGEWQVVLSREQNSTRNVPSRQAWEKETSDALACCGPSVAEIKPCR